MTEIITVDGQETIDVVINGGTDVVQVDPSTSTETLDVAISGGDPELLVVGLIGPQGSKGDAGQTGMVWRGDWDNSVTYVQYDGVYVDGSSYIAKDFSSPNLNVYPPENPDWWGMIASKADATAAIAAEVIRADAAYDPIGSAAAAQSNAEGYTDTAITNEVNRANTAYDEVGSANDARVAAESYADGLISSEVTRANAAYDPAGAADTAQSNAASYTDSAVHDEQVRADFAYDLVGSADTAQSNAEGYTDSAISNEVSRADIAYDAAGAAASAQSTAEGYTDSAILSEQMRADAAYDEAGSGNDARVAAGVYTDSAISSEASRVDGLLTSKADLVGGVVPSSQIPSFTINETYVVSDEAAMLALSANVGDIAIRTDVNRTFILQNTGASTLSNWVELAGAGDVLSVNGQTGIIVLGYADVGAASTSDPRLSDTRTPSASSITDAMIASTLSASLISGTFNSVTSSGDITATNGTDSIVLHSETGVTGITSSTELELSANNNGITIGASSSETIGFYGSGGQTQQTGDLSDALNALGLVLDPTLDVSKVTNAASLVASNYFTAGPLTLAGGVNFQFSNSTGTIFGLDATNKLAFYGATPIAKPTGNILTALTNLGLVGTPTIAPADVTGTAVITSDSRLSNARTPTAHKSTHAVGGTDALTPYDIGTQKVYAQTSAPSSPAAGDLWVDTDSTATALNPSDYVLQTDSRLSDSRVTESAVSALSLGTQAASQSTFTVYTVSSIAQRGIVTRMTITPDTPGNFDVEVRADASGGTLKYQAIGITTSSLDVQIPWAWKGASGQSFYIYIKNKDTASHSFTLTTLTVEKFA